MDFFGTVRGRLGYVFDRTLVYATGGLAYGDVRNGVNFFWPAGQLQFTGAVINIETGFTVGGGIEHAFAPNWTVKGEYLFYDLGRKTINVAVVPGSGGGGTGYNSTFENEGHIGRLRHQLQVRGNVTCCACVAIISVGKAALTGGFFFVRSLSGRYSFTAPVSEET